MTRLALVIPAYRPDPSLPELVADVLRLAPVIERVVVVDDGSGAACAATFAALRAMDRVRVVPHAVNLGKGAALKTGINAAFAYGAAESGAEDAALTGVVTADADGQHLAEDIAAVANSHAARPEHLILGVRSFAGSVPLRSRVGNGLTRLLFRFFTGIPVTDTQTGLRVWPRAYALDCLRLTMNGYEFEFEALLRAARRPIFEVPIQTVYRDGNRSSHFNPLRDSLRIYFVFLRYSASAMLAAVLDASVFSFTLWRTNDLLLSQVAGRSVATLVAFFVLRNLVFRSTGAAGRTLALFLLLVVGSGALSLQLIHMLVAAGINPLGAKLLAEGTLFLGNFAIQRAFIFRRD